ncbi:MAG: OmpA family protein [Acidobacteriota bacterium]
MKIPEEEVKPGAPEWVVTFGDMMSLLMVFFVLLLSFSSMEAEKFKQVAGMVRQAFGVQTEKSFHGIPAGDNVLDPGAQDNKEDEKIVTFERVTDWVIDQKLQDTFQTSLEERGVVLRASGKTLFDAGQVEVRSGATEILAEIARFLMSSDANLEVQGHTDSTPVGKGSPFPSNWELSSARAGSIVRHLVAAGVPPSRLRAVGFADTVPLSDNSTPAGRSANRRVEFLFIRD